MNREEIDRLLNEKMKLLAKINSLLEEVLNEPDGEVRDATGELVRQLKDNISEIDQQIIALEQEQEQENVEDVSEKSDQTEEDANGEQEENEDDGEEVYMDEPDVSIGRADDGTVLAVYDKRKKKRSKKKE